MCFSARERMSRSTLCGALCGIALILLSAAPSAIAQSYPARPIRVLTPNAPGGGLDVIARMIAPALTDNLGRAVVVDNRPGASGAIAMEIAAHAAPDGYTLAIFSVSQVIYAELNKANYAMFRDFAPVSQVAASPYVLAVSAQLPANSVSEFIAYAKANPDKLGYATSVVRVDRGHQARARAVQGCGRGISGSDRRPHAAHDFKRGIARRPAALEIAAPAGGDDHATHGDAARSADDDRSRHSRLCRHAVAWHRRACGHTARDRRAPQR